MASAVTTATACCCRAKLAAWVHPAGRGPVAYYVCRTCGAPLKPADQMRVDARRRPRFDTPQVMWCPNCGVHRGPLSERRVRQDPWHNLLIWAVVTAAISLLYVGYALWGGQPSWTGWLAVCAAACVAIGLPVALLVSLAHHRKARRIMAEWQHCRREGEAPEGAGGASHAA